MPLALFALLAAAASLHASGCSVDCHDNLTCGDAPGAGGGGGSGAGGGGFLCVPIENGSQAVDDSCGVFVSASGNDMGAGTKSEPLATFKKAIEKAGNTKRIYACAQEFTEAVELPAGFTVYGALGCGTSDPWQYLGKMFPTTLMAGAGEVPLKLLGGEEVTRLEDVHVVAAGAATAGGSSIAVIAEGASVELARCEVKAGNATDGAPGADEAAAAPGGGEGKAGGDACTANQVLGGAEVVNDTCDGASSTGGLGGNGTQSSALPGSNGKPAGVVNLGAAATQGMACGAGTQGSDGAPGDPGAGGDGLGGINWNGYAPVSGKDGVSGDPGQGGGGGGGAVGGVAADKCAAGMGGGAGGGSGGAGGCGGAGGKVGGAGGSSIAIISLSSTFKFADVKLVGGRGGKGGDGGQGQDGGMGGGGGAGGTNGGKAALNPGCNGGPGGSGGKGGRGGGGAGGHSVGIAFSAKMPSTDGATISLGDAGQGGMSDPMAPGASPGKQGELLEFPP